MPVGSQGGSDPSVVLSIGVDTLFTGVGVGRGREAVLVKAAALHRSTAATVLAALEAAGRSLGCLDIGRLLQAAPVIRLCTTCAQTSVVLRAGHPVGLLVAPELVEAGHRVLEGLGLPEELVVPVPEWDAPHWAQGIRDGVHRLLHRGCRSIGICLTGSRYDPAAELRVRAQIEADYPPHSLGAVPILLGSGCAFGRTDVERLTITAVDGYVRRSVGRHLNELEMAMAQAGFGGALLVAEGDGRLAPIPRVRPALTALAPQGALIVAAQEWLEQVGLPRGVALRLGSIHSEICVVNRGGTDRISPDHLLPARSVGGVASTLKRRSGRFLLTPPQGLSAPGPACFGWGGRVPTLADALLVAGYLGPHSLGAAGRPLDGAAARDALAGLVSQGSGGVETVAARVLGDVVDDLAAALRSSLTRANQGGQPAAFLACGRTGGLLACAVAERLGLREVHIMVGGGLVLTVGVSGMPLAQEFTMHLQPGGAVVEPAVLQAALTRLRRHAERTLHAARLGSTAVSWRAWLEYVARDHSTVQRLPLAAGEAGAPEGYHALAVSLELIGDLPGLSRVSLAGTEPAVGARSPRETARQVYLGPGQGWQECPVCPATELSPGLELAGPALVEAADAVHWIPPHWRYRVGTGGFARMERR